MATKTKTTWTDADVNDFINSFVEKKERKQDSFRLIELMREWSGFEPKMWGPTIIGFGRYHYKYASGHEGDAPLIGFSPRKAEFSLYVIDPTNDNNACSINWANTGSASPVFILRNWMILTLIHWKRLVRQ